MKGKKDIIFVSSEDDKYLVKGGIGTYLGIFVRTLAAEHPEYNVTWISQSPSQTQFEEQHGNVHRIYLPQPNQDLEKYSQSVESCVRKLIEQKLANGNSIIIESPEWEGLLANFYKTVDHDNLLKVTRIHTPLAVTAALNELSIEQNEDSQMRREKEQIISSDLISCPTDYVWEATISKVFSGQSQNLKRVKIPNCIDTTLFTSKNGDKKKAADIFRKLTGKEISNDDYNIFIIGSVEKRKGSDLVIKMAEQVIKHIPNANFYFIGHHSSGGKQELTANKKMQVDSLRSELSVATNQNIHFTGYVPHEHLPEIMAAGDLFVVCYLGDNFPGVVAEIGLSKKPMLALLRGGVKEMLETESGGYAALTIQGDTKEEIISQGVFQILAQHQKPEKGAELVVNPQFGVRLQ